jgi:hypothetical protein
VDVVSVINGMGSSDGSRSHQTKLALLRYVS